MVLDHKLSLEVYKLAMQAYTIQQDSQVESTLRLEMNSSTLKRSTEEKPHSGSEHCLHNGHNTRANASRTKEHAVKCVGDEVRKGNGQ